MAGVIHEKETTMTPATMALSEHAEKGPDIHLLSRIAQVMDLRLMETDSDG